jgi:Flp pilus assembly secretin CpaC
MDVRVVEFKNRDKVRELGIRWDEGANGPAFGIAGDIKSSPVGDGRFVVAPPQGSTIVGIDAMPRPIAPFRTYLGLVSVLNSRISLMETDGDAVTLAQPQLTARSGKQAEFHVGGQIPYATFNPLGQATVQFQDFGIIVKIKSWVDRLDQVQSDIEAEFSEPDQDVNPRAGVPGLRKRRAATSFNVRSGETMVIAGLLQRRKGEAVARVPGLGSLPLVGELFKHRRSTDADSELVVFVTPTIVDMGDPEQARRLGQALLRAERYFDPPAAPASAPAP